MAFTNTLFRLYFRNILAGKACISISTTQKSIRNSIFKESIPGHTPVRYYCSQEVHPDIQNKSLQLKRQKLSQYLGDKIKMVREVLQIKSTKAHVLLKKYPQLGSFNSETLLQNFENLKSKGVSEERILAMPWLLCLHQEQISDKFDQVKETLRIESFQCAAPFLQLPHSRLQPIGDLWQSELMSEMRNFGDFKNRVDYLAKRLKCDSIDVADMMSKAPTIMSASISVLEEKLNMLMDYGVEPEDVVKDPYVFKFTPSMIGKRLKLCKEEGLDLIKPWMLRCTPIAFNLYVQRVHREQELREGHKDILDFLKEKLDCGECEVQEIILRVPSVKKASAIKLYEMISFLYSHGFTSEQIIETPRVLGHSVETIDERIRELSSYGYNPQFLNVLCQTSTHYSSFIRRLLPNTAKTTSSETVDRLSN